MIMEQNKGENEMTGAASLPPVNAERRWLRYRELEERVGMCGRTIRRAVDKGEMPKPIKVCGCVLFDWLEVVAFLLARKGKST
jgi:predicted DNA-binding transcriptional regulator AlpA